MSDDAQISAYIARETREKLERYATMTGKKKSRIVEDALEHHLAAVDEIPDEYIVPKRLVLSAESFDEVLDRMDNPREPTEALRRLMRETSEFFGDHPQTES